MRTPLRGVEQLPQQKVFFRCRSGQAGRALLPGGTRESSRNQESEQSSAAIVPQLRVAADMTRRYGKLTLKPEDSYWKVL